MMMMMMMMMMIRSLRSRLSWEEDDDERSC